MNRRLFLLCLVLISLMLAACGEEEPEERSAPPPNLVITYEPQPQTTLLPGCETADLESWLEVSGSLIYIFRDESLAAVNLEPTQMGDTLDRLIELRDTIARQPAPECALQPHSEILIVIRGMLTGFQRYTNGVLSKDELTQQINTAVEQINTHITVLLDSATTDLRNQFDQGE